jgi:hypothetical protein
MSKAAEIHDVLKIRGKNYFLHRHHLGRWLPFAKIEQQRVFDFHASRLPRILNEMNLVVVIWGLKTLKIRC